MIKVSQNNFLLSNQNPSAKALISSSLILNYQELKQKVLSTAEFLKSKNINSGEQVGILSQNNTDFVINVLALWQISAVPVLINIRLTDSEIEDQLNSANCSSVLIQMEFSGKVKSSNLKEIIFPDIKTETSIITATEDLELNNPAVIIFTSGSTSKSKGVILSFESLYNSAINGNHLLRYTISDRWLASLPFYHVGGFSIITRAILFGIPLLIPDSLSIQDLISAKDKWQPTFISLVSTQLKKIVDEGIAPNIELKNCLLGGGFTDQKLLTKAYDNGWPVNLVYGSSETSSFVTALLKDEIIFKPNSVGRAVPTNKIQICDNLGSELKPFEIGEITIQSNALMAGYLDKNETDKVLKNGLYFSDDIGYMDEEGYLFLEGRKNHLISSGGENINPIEVEDILIRHPSIKEAVVYPVKDDRWGEIVAASIVLREKSMNLSFDEIKIFLKEKLPDFKIPKKIFFEEKLPKTDLGKVQKEKLIERYKFTSL